MTTAAAVEAKGKPARGTGATALALFLGLFLFWMLAGPASPIADGRLRDNDDYMRLVQVDSWLNGAGWSDTVEDRLNPPRGASLHWSRLPDLPIAAVALAVEPFMERRDALLFAAFLIPGLLLIAFLYACRWAAAPLLGPALAPFAGLFAAMQMSVVGLFSAGRIDHHGWQLIVATLLLGATLHLLKPPGSRAAAAVGAVATGLGLWIGGEIAPWIACAHLALGLAWIRTGDAALLRAGLRLGLGGAMVAAAALLVALPPGDWLAPVCDGLSPAYVATPALAAAAWGGMALAAQRGLAVRIAAAGIAGALAAILFAVAFPACRAGPYGGVDPYLYDVWMSQIAEMWPLPRFFAAAPVWAPAFVATAIVGTIAATLLALRGGADRSVHLTLAIFAGSALALTFWQTRVHGFAALFGAFAVADLALRAFRRAGRFGLPARVGARLAAAAIPTIVLGVYLPSAAARALAPKADADAPPAESRIATSCDLKAAAAHPLLAQSRAEPLRIAAFIDMGAELLFRTPQAVLAAPYHRNGDGNLATARLFAGTDDAAARRLLTERGIGLVMLCPGEPEMRLYDVADSLASRLARGEAPDWLRPVDLNADGVLAFIPE